MANKRNLSLALIGYHRIKFAASFVVLMNTLLPIAVANPSQSAAQVPPRSGVVEQREKEKPRITIRNFSHGSLVLDSGLEKPQPREKIKMWRR